MCGPGKVDCSSPTRVQATAALPVRAFSPAVPQALKAAQVRYEVHLYPGVNHGFHNDTTPRYDDAAAKLAWQRTVDFFNASLR